VYCSKGLPRTRNDERPLRKRPALERSAEVGREKHGTALIDCRKKREASSLLNAFPDLAAHIPGPLAPSIGSRSDAGGRTRPWGCGRSCLSDAIRLAGLRRAVASMYVQTVRDPILGQQSDRTAQGCGRGERDAIELEVRDEPTLVT
jgi:hypothetical protein